MSKELFIDDRKLEQNVRIPQRPLGEVSTFVVESLPGQLSAFEGERLLWQ